MSKIIWIIVAIVVIIGAVYMYSGYYGVKERRRADEPRVDPAEEMAAVEQELKDIPVEGLDAALDDIEKEIAQ